MLQDVIDLRNNGWELKDDAQVPENKGPKLPNQSGPDKDDHMEGTIQEQDESAPQIQGLPTTFQYFPFQELQMQGAPLGSGSAKTVRRALLRGSDVVAVTVQRNAVDAGLFEQLGQHPQLARVLGASRDPAGLFVVIVEFAPMGSLDNILIKLKQEGHAVSSAALVASAVQICEGMEQVAKAGLVHRNLALRNVLVFGFDCSSPRAVHVKVTDHGLTCEDRCFYKGNHALPFRWMSPEVLKRRQWSEKSDVWAFGVLLWELWSPELLPFAFLESDERVAELVSEGLHLPKPDTCPENVYAIMVRCWERAPTQRPSFSQLREELLAVYAES